MVMAGEGTSRAGALLREWRQRRKLSQLDLALLADSSARHLSCLETGRARPSRAMVLKLATALDIPLRERNTLLVAADHAPAYPERDLADTDMSSVRAALEVMLAAHEPFPAVVVDRWWNVVSGNQAMSVFLDDVPPALLRPRPNVFRLTLHPEGLAARLSNLAQTRTYFLDRLLRQVHATGDADLRALYEEVRGYPVATQEEGAEEVGIAGGPREPSSPIQVPLRVRTPAGELSMFTTMATFGAPADVTLSELAIELFYPLDEFTSRVLRGED